MSRLNFLVRDPISFVGGPWRATADLVHGRVVTMLHCLYVCPERRYPDSPAINPAGGLFARSGSFAHTQHGRGYDCQYHKRE